MAFMPSNLVVSDAVAFDFDYGRVWSYTTTDSLSDVEDGIYFNTTQAAQIFRQADWLRVTASDGKGIYMITSSTYSTPEVDISKQASVSSF